MYKSKWKSPSNIALVKYWGKLKGQFPINPSLSFSLQNSYTITSVEYERNSASELVLDYYFEGEKNDQFGDRIQKYLHSLKGELPWLINGKMIIHSENSFPHSTGIASSASAFSALALCLSDIHYQIENKAIDEAFYQLASHFARLGSGSASRSVYGGIVHWGESPLKGGNQKTAVQLESKSPWGKLYDSILIVNSSPKKVSSSAGHQTMENHPYRSGRIDQANRHMEVLHKSLIEGDWESFAEVCMNEALSLHSLMMSASPGFMLLESGSVNIVQGINDKIKQTGIKLCYTIDAGPNIHLIYPEESMEEVKRLIETELLQFCEDGKWLDDQMGSGPEKM